MSDSDRTEAPSPRKLRRARERGEVPQSPLLGAALGLAGVAAAIAIGGEAMLGAWRGLLERTWSPGVAPAEALADAAGVGAQLLAAPLAAAVVLGALASFVQVGPLFTGRPLAPDLARLDPARGLSKMFSPSGLAPRAGGLALAILVLVLAAIVLRESLPGLLGRTSGGASFALAGGGAVLGAFAARAVAALGLAAVAGVAYRRWRFLRDQRMSRREVREEQRETEGEPEARRRRAQLHRERALGPSVEEALAEAALVVRGGGRAIVLRFDASSGDAPAVLLVARGPLEAQVVRAAARDAIAVVHDPPLAQALERGRPLPRALLRRLAAHLARERARG